MNKDCIFYQEEDRNLPQYHVCNRRGTLYGIEEECEMCNNCRLWDAYIPKTATEQEKTKAIQWQDANLYEQEDYEEYFKNK